MNLQMTLFVAMVLKAPSNKYAPSFQLMQKMYRVHSDISVKRRWEMGEMGRWDFQPADLAISNAEGVREKNRRRGAEHRIFSAPPAAICDFGFFFDFLI